MRMSLTGVNLAGICITSIPKGMADHAAYSYSAASGKNHAGHEDWVRPVITTGGFPG